MEIPVVLEDAAEGRDLSRPPGPIPTEQRKAGAWIVVVCLAGGDEVGVVCRRPCYVANSPVAEIESDERAQLRRAGGTVEKRSGVFDAEQDRLAVRMRVAQSDQQGFSILANGKALNVEPVLFGSEVRIGLVEVADGFAQRIVGFPGRRRDGFWQATEGR